MQNMDVYKFCMTRHVKNAHIKEGMDEQGVTDIRRITVRRDGIIKPTNTFDLTFNSPNLPTVVKIGFMMQQFLPGITLNMLFGHT